MNIMLSIPDDQYESFSLCLSDLKTRFPDLMLFTDCKFSEATKVVRPPLPTTYDLGSIHPDSAGLLKWLYQRGVAIAPDVEGSEAIAKRHGDKKQFGLGGVND